MPKFSKSSAKELSTASLDLQTLAEYVVKYFDCTVVFGSRTPAEQFKLYKKGRKEVNGVWMIVDKKKVVTYKDGYNKKSKHNYLPSQAIDLAPYPIDWDDEDRMRYFAGYVMGIAKMLKEVGLIKSDIIWGGDWDDDTDLSDQSFMDLVHFQTK